jgi:tRNA uridine 5-carboxymethylaminomethyl modification enzyme
MGLAKQERMEKVNQKKQEVAAIKEKLATTNLEPSEVNPFFEGISSAAISEKQRVEKIVLRPNVSLDQMRSQVNTVDKLLNGYSSEAIEQAEIQVKYQVYIDKEKDLVNRMKQLEDLEIPEQFDYKRIVALGAEAREKLTKVRPRTLGQASRISGINPSDVQILMVFMGR